ncbi:MAG: hypothetical protein V4736_09695 [Bdellovibrionota bacterium]
MAYGDQNGTKFYTVDKSDVLEIESMDYATQADLFKSRGLNESFAIQSLKHRFPYGPMKMTVRRSMDPNKIGKSVYVHNSQLGFIKLVDDGTTNTGEYLDESGELIDDSEAPVEGSYCATCEHATKSMNPLTSIAQQGMKAVSAISIETAMRSYSGSPQVRRLIQTARNNIEGGNASKYIRKTWSPKLQKYVVQTKCYRAVKDALIDSDLVSPNFAAGSLPAREGKQYLLKEGFTDLLQHPKFKNLVANPDMAPTGAILVYEGTNYTAAQIAKGQNYGHIEIKTARSGEGGYISFNKTIVAANGMATSRNGNPPRRKLIGVMVKI